MLIRRTPVLSIHDEGQANHTATSMVKKENRTSIEMLHRCSDQPDINHFHPLVRHFADS